MMSIREGVNRVAATYAVIEEANRPEIWISLRDQQTVSAEVTSVLERAAAGADLPLAGLFFAVKNNIDVAGLPTTAACPAYAYQPGADAVAVARLRDAGAVVVGSTNLDQFATGLVGTRSPYGAVRHATAPERISGGSSSGSAVAVALGMVDFALGTDTAGSGRVPAALQGLFGIKPTRGMIPTVGVVPACASLDVVTVMDSDLARAALVAELMRGPDRRDPVSCRRSSEPTSPITRLGVATDDSLGALAPGWAEAYHEEIDHWRDAGAEISTVDISDLLRAASLLYDGAFVAERYTAVGAFVDSHLDEVDPTVGSIVQGARDIPAWRLFQDEATLAAHQLRADDLWRQVDALLLPTTTWHPTLDQVQADPIGANTRMGRYTNFVNLLDMCALAYPAGEVDGLPFGVQLIGPAHADRRLLEAVDG